MTYNFGNFTLLRPFRFPTRVWRATEVTGALVPLGILCEKFPNVWTCFSCWSFVIVFGRANIHHLLWVCVNVLFHVDMLVRRCIVKRMLFVNRCSLMYFTCVNGPACTLFTGQPVYAARASPSVMARSWPTARIPEPVLTARTGPSRAYGLALARRISDLY